MSPGKPAPWLRNSSLAARREETGELSAICRGLGRRGFQTGHHSRKRPEANSALGRVCPLGKRIPVDWPPQGSPWDDESGEWPAPLTGTGTTGCRDAGQSGLPVRAETEGGPCGDTAVFADLGYDRIHEVSGRMVNGAESSVDTTTQVWKNQSHSELAL